MACQGLKRVRLFMALFWLLLAWLCPSKPSKKAAWNFHAAFFCAQGQASPNKQGVRGE